MARKIILSFLVFLAVSVPVFADTVPRYPMDNSILLSYGRDMMSKLGVNDHYVYFLSDQYTYTFIWGRDINLSGSTFRFTGCSRVSFTFYPGYNDSYRYYPSYYGVSSSSVGTSGSVVAGGFVCYSDLGNYPDLRSEDSYYAFFILVSIFIVIFMSILRFIWGCVRR